MSMKEMFIVMTLKKPYHSILCNYKIAREHSACYLSAGKHAVSKMAFSNRRKIREYPDRMLILNQVLF